MCLKNLNIVFTWSLMADIYVQLQYATQKGTHKRLCLKPYFILYSDLLWFFNVVVGLEKMAFSVMTHQTYSRGNCTPSCCFAKSHKSRPSLFTKFVTLLSGELVIVWAMCLLRVVQYRPFDLHQILITRHILFYTKSLVG